MTGSHIVEGAKAAKADGFILQVEPDVPVGQMVVQRVRPNYAACNPADVDRYVAALNAVGFDVFVVDTAKGTQVWHQVSGIVSLPTGLYTPAESISQAVVLPAGAGAVVPGEDLPEEVAPGPADSSNGLLGDGGEA